MTKSRRPGDAGPPESPDAEIRAEYDWSDVPPSTAVIETLAIALNREPTMIDPLYDSVDPDALGRLVRPEGQGPPDGGLSVSFTYEGHDVTADSAGMVVVRRVEPGRE